MLVENSPTRENKAEKKTSQWQGIFVPYLFYNWYTSSLTLITDNDSTSHVYNLEEGATQVVNPSQTNEVDNAHGIQPSFSPDPDPDFTLHYTNAPSQVQKFFLTYCYLRLFIYFFVLQRELQQQNPGSYQISRQRSQDPNSQSRQGNPYQMQEHQHYEVSNFFLSSFNT